MAQDDEEKPWYAPGHGDSVSGSVCTPRPRERLWTLVKGGKRVDAELLFHNEPGVEVQFARDGVMAYAQRFPLKTGASPKPSITARGWNGRAGLGVT